MCNRAAGLQAIHDAGGMNALSVRLVVLIWGTTWIALKWQLGPVPIALSIAYRFGLAALVLFAWLASGGASWSCRAARRWAGCWPRGCACSA